MYFNGDPTVYKEYKQHIVLPVGSAPGTWGLAKMNVTDKFGIGKSTTSQRLFALRQ